MPISRRLRTTALTAALVLALVACSGSDDGPSTAAPATATSAAASTAPSGPWTEDLEALDAEIRRLHPAPFVKTSEAVWEARIDELEQTLPTMSDVDATVAVTELVGLLDSHSGLYPYEVGFHFYGVVLFEFADGVHVLNAYDRSLVGARLVSIGDTPIAQVLDAITPLVAADNESALHDTRPIDAIVVEYLQAKGIVEDPAHPRFAFALEDGTTTTVDPPMLTIDEASPLLVGGEVNFDPGPPFTAPEAVARRGEELWFEQDEAHHAFVIHYGYSETGIDTTPALAALRAALDGGQVDRLVLDVRYARGGAYSVSAGFREALAAEPRINRPGGLFVVVGRESYSATTAVVSWLEQHTAATFVGEPTPARPNTLLDETVFELPNSGLPVHFPTTLVEVAGAGDTRDAVRPDIPVEPTAAAFFAGQDEALEAALTAPAAS